jgi:hypothetical protein
LKKIGNEFQNDIYTLEPIEELRRDMLERLVDTEESDSKVNRLLAKLVKIMKELDLPELDDDERSGI